MAEMEKCEHDLCKCMVKDDDADYCSPQCETSDATDMTELKCDCGHDGCS